MNIIIINVQAITFNLNSLISPSPPPMANLVSHWVELLELAKSTE